MKWGDDDEDDDDPRKEELITQLTSKRRRGEFSATRTSMHSPQFQNTSTGLWTIWNRLLASVCTPCFSVYNLKRMRRRRIVIPNTSVASTGMPLSDSTAKLVVCSSPEGIANNLSDQSDMISAATTTSEMTPTPTTFPKCDTSICDIRRVESDSKIPKQIMSKLREEGKMTIQSGSVTYYLRRKYFSNLLFLYDNLQYDLQISIRRNAFGNRSILLGCTSIHSLPHTGCC